MVTLWSAILLVTTSWWSVGFAAEARPPVRFGVQVAQTQRIRLGILVSGNIYRHPAVLAKMATVVPFTSRPSIISASAAMRASPRPDSSDDCRELSRITLW